MHIRPGAPLLHALSRATEPRPAASAERLAELQSIARAARAANAATVAAQRAPQQAPASAVAQVHTAPAVPGVGSASAPVKPRGSLLNIVV